MNGAIRGDTLREQETTKSNPAHQLQLTSSGKRDDFNPLTPWCPGPGDTNCAWLTTTWLIMNTSYAAVQPITDKLTAHSLVTGRSTPGVMHDTKFSLHFETIGRTKRMKTKRVRGVTLYSNVVSVCRPPWRQSS